MKQRQFVKIPRSDALPLPTNKDFDPSMSTRESRVDIINFPDNVGHLLHALSLEELQTFEPTFTADNGIPTTNRNLTDVKNLVLPNAVTLGEPKHK